MLALAALENYCATFARQACTGSALVAGRRCPVLIVRIGSRVRSSTIKSTAQ